MDGEIIPDGIIDFISSQYLWEAEAGEVWQRDITVIKLGYT
jgi:hypothetical protein